MTSRWRPRRGARRHHAGCVSETRARPPTEPTRGATRGGARTPRGHGCWRRPPASTADPPSPARSPARCLSLCSSFVLFLLFSLQVAQISSTVRTLTSVFGKRGIEGVLLLPLCLCELAPRSNPEHSQCVLAWERRQEGTRGHAVGLCVCMLDQQIDLP